MPLSRLYYLDVYGMYGLFAKFGYDFIQSRLLTDWLNEEHFIQSVSQQAWLYKVIAKFGNKSTHTIDI